jgi:hypothetical protein
MKLQRAQVFSIPACFLAQHGQKALLRSSEPFTCSALDQGSGDTREVTAKKICRDTFAQANLTHLEYKFMEFKLP